MDPILRYSKKDKLKLNEPIRIAVEQIAERKRRLREKNAKATSTTVPDAVPKRDSDAVPKRDSDAVPKRDSDAVPKRKSKFSTVPAAKPQTTVPAAKPQTTVPAAKPITYRYRHTKIAAVLSIGAVGFTLSNGVESVFQDEGLNGLVEEVISMKVSVLHCFDEHTHLKWLNLQQKDAYIFKNLKVVQMNRFPITKCIYCHETLCDKWNACAGITEIVKGHRFDPIPHLPQTSR